MWDSIVVPMISSLDVHSYESQSRDSADFGVFVQKSDIRIVITKVDLCWNWDLATCGQSQLR
jgi:hypothetical protein